jgi:hypothetical protein
MRMTYTIQQFCDGYNVSRSTFYRERDAGRAPDLMKVGRRVLISIEAAEEWARKHRVGRQPPADPPGLSSSFIEKAP